MHQTKPLPQQPKASIPPIARAACLLRGLPGCLAAWLPGLQPAWLPAWLPARLPVSWPPCGLGDFTHPLYPLEAWVM
jgi:hypothetical protein